MDKNFQKKKSPAPQRDFRKDFIFFFLALVIGNIVFVILAVLFTALSLPKIWTLVISLLVTIIVILAGYLRFYYRFIYQQVEITTPRQSKKKDIFDSFSIKPILVLRGVGILSAAFLLIVLFSKVDIGPLASKFPKPTQINQLTSEGTLVKPVSEVSFNISIHEPKDVPTHSAINDVLLVSYRVDCYCKDDRVVAVLSLQPKNGTPPYFIPGFEFVESQSFSGNIGDVYSVTTKSSDDPPLIWRADIALECATPSMCTVPTKEYASSSQVPNEATHENGTDAEYMKETKEAVADSGGTVGITGTPPRPAKESTIYYCPPRGITPPGICKKR